MKPNSCGTNDFQFFNTHVTSVVEASGYVSNEDAILGHRIIGNLNHPFAKTTDLDPDDLIHSTLYGSKFGIQWNTNNDIAFYGNWSPSILTQNLWQCLKCYNETHSAGNPYVHDFALGAQSTTFITGVDWINFEDSAVLTQLQEVSNRGNLMVRITLQYYTSDFKPYISHNATLGYVLGVIGVPSSSDTLNFPGERVMVNTSNIPAGLTFDTNDLCHQQDLSYHAPWMFTAPFEVDLLRNEVRVDLSNSIPINLKNSLRNIGTLRLGVYKESEACVCLLGDESGIPYLSDHRFQINSGIYSITFDPSLKFDVTSSPLIVAQILDDRQGNRICGESIFSKLSAMILLQEKEYYIRPKGLYIDRLDRKESATSVQTLFVTKYGKPEEGIAVVVKRSNRKVVPENGVVPSSWIATTDEDGLVAFTFSLHDIIPQRRVYDVPKCNNTTSVLPIDGQVYQFTYCAAIDPAGCESLQEYSTMSFLAFSDVSYGDTPTWVDDVGPIFSQYAHLTPMMKAILDLSSFVEVTKPHNINLLNLTLRLDFQDSSYMPTTRDLSPAKREMILRWLKHPLYDLHGSSVTENTPVCMPSSLAQPRMAEYFMPARCSSSRLQFKERPDKHDRHFNVFQQFPNSVTIQGRPLFGAMYNLNLHCTRENIESQLQTAIQLEWATIPTYLTSLFSIVDGCNAEIYALIESVIRQEMLHMTLSANLLIAMNGSPLIDDAKAVPQYPTSLPGGILPGLEVHLKRLSLEHIYDTFLRIEVPEETLVASPQIFTSHFTVGAFYQEIATCIGVLRVGGEEIFDASTLHKQVKWPWTPAAYVGTVIPITDSFSAMEAIREITAQGEGASLLDPTDIGTNSLAHFFKFEEIVCQHHLEQVDGDSYAYIGASIPFQPEGVWPMRDDPTIATVLPNTNCYTESRVFHNTYRKLLHKLQEVFDGSPDEIFQAVKLMESLQAQGKALMRVKFNPDSPRNNTTCGPVWDYDWPLP